jgi:hypothetical protein
MDPTKAPTKEEALKLNKDALEADIARKKENIKMLQGEITRLEMEISWMQQAIAIIINS